MGGERKGEGLSSDAGERVVGISIRPSFLLGFEHGELKSLDERDGLGDDGIVFSDRDSPQLGLGEALSRHCDAAATMELPQAVPEIVGIITWGTEDHNFSINESMRASFHMSHI